MASDIIQGSEYLAHNFPGLTGNGNFQTYEYDFNSGDGRYKGSAALAENTDGSLTFWAFSSNFLSPQVWSETYQYTWFITGGNIDPTATGATAALILQSGPGYGNNGSDPYAIGNAPIPGDVVCPCIQPSRHDFFSLNGVRVFRALFVPHGSGSTTAGMTIGMGASHWENGHGGNHGFADPGPGGLLTLRGAYIPPPAPTLVSVSPTSSDRLGRITLTGTGLTQAYRPYFGSTSAPAPDWECINSTTILCTVPNIAPGATQIFCSDGTLQTGNVSFTINANVLRSGYSPPASIKFPKPIVIQPPPTLVSVSVKPKAATLVEGQSAQFSASGVWSDASTRTLTPADGLAWTVINVSGNGTVDPSSGLFVAHIAGSEVDVVAAVGQLQDSATVVIAQQTIPASQLLSLSVSPASPNMQLGATLQFHSQGLSEIYQDINGLIVGSAQTTYPPVSWHVANGTGAGTIDQFGLFTATDLAKGLATKWWSGSLLPDAGQGELSTAPSLSSINSGEFAYPSGITGPVYSRTIGYLIPNVSGSYTLGLNYSAGANLFINGQPLVLDLHGTKSFGATATYISSGTMQLQAGVRYPVVIEWFSGTGSQGCELVWTVPGAAAAVVPLNALEYDAGAGATVTITAVAKDGSGISASQVVTINGAAPPAAPPAGLSHIQVSPKNVTVTAGQTQQFSCVGIDQYGESFPISIQWSIVCGQGAATIDPNSGLLKGEIAGGQITVTATTLDPSHLTDTGAVTVTAGPLAKIVVTPPSVTLQKTQGQNFTATGFDSYGNAKILSNLIWSVAGGLGSINSSGVFTSVASGVGKVVASSGALSGAATVNVLQVVGGVQQTTPPQVPFARIHLRNTVDVPLIVDTRRRGGGIRSADVLKLGDDFWWDLTSFDGDPFAMYGVFAAQVIVPALTGQSVDPDASKALVQAVLDKYSAPHFLGLVTPATSIPSNPNL